MTIFDVMKEAEGQYSSMEVYGYAEGGANTLGSESKETRRYHNCLLVDSYVLMDGPEYSKRFNLSPDAKRYGRLFKVPTNKVLCIMLAEKRTVFEYCIEDGMVVKRPHLAEVGLLKGVETYSFKTGRNNTTNIVTNSNKFGVIKSNRVYSLEDDLEKYGQQLVDRYKEQTDELRARLDERIEVIESLERTWSI